MRNTESLNVKTNNLPYFVSWSGGKDSCLSLFRSIQKFGQPKCLLNMLTEEGARSRSHGILKEILEKQAYLLQVPIHFYATTWNNYEETFLNALHDFNKHDIQMGVFGDIKIPDDLNWSMHCKWAEKICNEAHIIAYEPLWDDKIENILNEFIEVGFTAKIISVKSNFLSPDYLGKVLDHELIAEFKRLGIHPAGERGEYHTLVTNGPIFTKPLLVKEQQKIFRDNYWFLDLGLAARV